MKKNTLSTVATLATLFCAQLGFSQTMTGREIMEMAEDFQRASTDSAFNRMQLST